MTARREVATSCIASIPLEQGLRLDLGESANFPSGRYCVNAVYMDGQETSLTQKRRGPKPTGQGHVVGVRLQPSDLEALDAWIASHEGDQSRPEAIRKLMRLGMTAQNT
jgi:hypothetical protein